MSYKQKEVLTRTDKELIISIKKGNEQAFDVLFKKYYAQLARFANMFTKDADNADEVVQSFFVKLWQNRNNLKINTSVKSYLFTSVRNASLNFLKKEKTRTLYEEKVETEDTKIKEDKSLEFKVAYNEAIKNLPERTRQVFVLSKNEGLTYKEIAEYLEITAKTVENNMGIAFRKLRKILMPYKNLIYE